ncbi:MAG: RNA polymerase sigma factor [Woeseiaceae bacterium]|nr:RNA polymerase sigma factor [Woeseiaceae bacterium]
MTDDDDTLIRNFAARRDESSFRRLYRRHTPAMFAMAVRLRGSHSEAEELTQEAWCRAVERFDRFDRRSALRTWLIGILINCFREDVRRRRRSHSASESELQKLSDSLVTPLPVTRRTPAEPIDVERALSKLPAGYREIVLLHDLNGYTHKEIAAMLGIQEGTSKSQLTRGREHLRKLLAAAPAVSRSTDKRERS